MYGRWTSDEHGLKPDKIERLDDLPLPHIRQWAASSSSSGGFQILVLEITCSDHGSVTLCDYQRAWDQKRSQKSKSTWFLRFCFLRMGDRNWFLGPGCRGGGVLVVVWESARREQSTASSFHSPPLTASGQDHPPSSENKHHNWKRSACQQGWILLYTVSTWGNNECKNWKLVTNGTSPTYISKVLVSSSHLKGFEMFLWFESLMLWCGSFPLRFRRLCCFSLSN